LGFGTVKTVIASKGCAAGFVGLRSRFGRCDRAVRWGVLQPAFRTARSSRPWCLARHAGHHGVVEKAQALPAAKRRSSLGRLRCRVEGGPARAKTKSNLRDRTGREAEERTSVFAERANLRGGARNWRPIVACRTAFAQCIGPGAGMKCGRGNRPLYARAGTTRGCAVGSRRGFARRKARDPYARFGRSSRVTHFRVRAERGARCSRRPAVSQEKAKAKGKRRCEARRLTSRSGIRRPAAMARASSYCRSRQAVLRLRETRPRQRAGRKPERGKRRVDGGLATSG
jgi:hypothetical protein